MLPSSEQIHFCRSRDGTSIAYSTSGAGPPLVFMQHWAHHLNFDPDSPIWRPWLKLLARRHTLIRYDWRGCGLSDRDNIRYSFQNSFEDFEAVVEAAGLKKFSILAMSGTNCGVAIRFAIQKPERITKLVLFGPCCNRRAAAGAKNQIEETQARLKVFQLGWPADNIAYGNFFSSLHIPSASAEEVRAYNAALRITTSPFNVMEIIKSFWQIDLTGDLPKVNSPTLILHSRDDSIVPFSEGRTVAALIPGALFVPIESSNHILLESEPGWRQFKEALDDFLPAPSDHEAILAIKLTVRERSILECLAQGMSNDAIGGQLEISEKTVRNYISIIFDKLGVHSRSQAIVRARDSGFGRQSTAAN